MAYYPDMPEEHMRFKVFVPASDYEDMAILALTQTPSQGPAPPSYYAPQCTQNKIYTFIYQQLGKREPRPQK